MVVELLMKRIAWIIKLVNYLTLQYLLRKSYRVGFTQFRFFVALSLELSYAD